MRPYAGTVGRAVFEPAAVLGGRDASACAPSGAGAYSRNDMLMMLRRPRTRAGFSIRTIES